MSIIVAELERPSFTEWRATVRGPGGVSVAESAAAAYRQLAASMAAARVAPFSEKAYCAAGARHEVGATRRAALLAHGLDADCPWMCLVGPEPRAAALASSPEAERRAERALDDRSVQVQLWGVARPAPTVRVSSVEAGPCRGRLLEAVAGRALWLGPIEPRDRDGQLSGGVAAQAQAMFEHAERALESMDFSFGDVVRTWIYVRDLLAGYRELNRVRTGFYAARGIGAEPHPRPFPASTGIQGRVADEECVMDLLAFRPSPGVAAVAPLASSERQGPAFAYGSSFSRAMSLELEGRKTILVSGTASIGPDGATLHAGDPERQAVETLLCIAALIEPAGATLRDIAAGTLFARDAQALAAFERVERALCLPTLPLARVRADVCRPDLALEIEAVVYAAGSLGRGRP